MARILRGFVTKWGYILVIAALVVAYIGLPKNITIPRTEVLIAGGFFLLYIVIADIKTEFTNRFSVFTSQLFKTLEGIQSNLPVKSNPGKYPPIDIPPSQKKPSQAGESAFAGLVFGGIVGGLIGGGPGAVIGGLLGAILGDTIKRNAGVRRKK